VTAADGGHRFGVDPHTVLLRDTRRPIEDGAVPWGTTLAEARIRR
jgi:hypothetical protein